VTRRGCWPRLTGALAGLLAFAAIVGVVPSGSTSALAPRMGLISQAPYGVAADGSVEFVLSLPTSIVPAALPAATLVVTAYRAVTTRAGITEAQGGVLPRSVDSVDLPLAALPRPTADQIVATVPLETSTRTAPALQLAQPGLYPVVLELRNAGSVVAELLTFVHRLPSATDDPEVALPVAMAMTTTSPVVLDDNGAVVIDDGVVAELTQLADLLDSSPMPVAVRVPPALLIATAQNGEAGAALAQRLADGLARNEVLSVPRYPLDPSLAAASAQQNIYTQWLRDGEDDLTAFTDNLPSDTVAFMDGPLSADGGALLRDLGTRLIVTTPEIFDRLPNSTAGFTDSSKLVQIQIASDQTIEATLIDRDLDSVLEQPTTTPALTGIYAITHLLAYRQEIVDNTKDRTGSPVGNPSRRGVTLATSDLSLPNLDTYRAITALLADTPGLTPTTLESLGLRTEQLSLPDRGDVIVGLPDAVEGSIHGRLATAADLTQATKNTGSMLPADDPRLARWNTSIRRLPTSALTDAQVAATADQITAELDTIRAAVQVPSTFPFTLTGRTTTVPFRLFNQGDVPLRVSIHMSSLKLLFPDGDLSVVIPPQGSASVDIRMEARTNGDFRATLTVLTPSGELLAPPVPLNASVTALTGLGNLFTGAFLLVVLTWWVRHVRQSRRNRAAAVAAARHPGRQVVDLPDDPPNLAADEADDSGDDETALSPDAATSTLPPS